MKIRTEVINTLGNPLIGRDFRDLLGKIAGQGLLNLLPDLMLPKSIPAAPEAYSAPVESSQELYSTATGRKLYPFLHSLFSQIMQRPEDFFRDQSPNPIDQPTITAQYWRAREQLGVNKVESLKGTWSIPRRGESSLAEYTVYAQATPGSSDLCFPTFGPTDLRDFSKTINGKTTAADAKIRRLVFEEPNSVLTEHMIPDRSLDLARFFTEVGADQNGMPEALTILWPFDSPQTPILVSSSLADY